MGCGIQSAKAKIRRTARMANPKQIFVSDSHADSEHLLRLRVHLRPYERQSLLELWSDPVGQQLNYGGRNARNRTYVYIGTRKRCGGCAQKAQCTSGPFWYLAIHMHEPARQRARDLAETPAFAHAQRERKKVEALFAELAAWMMKDAGVPPISCDCRP